MKKVAAKLIRAIGLSRKGHGPKRINAPFRVLVVDDEDGPRNEIAKLVQEHGKYVQTASDGLGALELLRIEQFDVLVTDLMMPRMDGFELLAELRTTPTAPVAVVLSGSVSSGSTMVQIRDLGAFWYLEKPANREAILAIIDRAAQFAPVRSVPRR